MGEPPTLGSDCQPAESAPAGFPSSGRKTAAAPAQEAGKTDRGAASGQLRVVLTRTLAPAPSRGRGGPGARPLHLALPALPVPAPCPRLTKRPLCAGQRTGGSGCRSRPGAPSGLCPAPPPPEPPGPGRALRAPLSGLPDVGGPGCPHDRSPCRPGSWHPLLHSAFRDARGLPSTPKRPTSPELCAARVGTTRLGPSPNRADGEAPSCPEFSAVSLKEPAGPASCLRRWPWPLRVGGPPVRGLVLGLVLPSLVARSVVRTQGRAGAEGPCRAAGLVSPGWGSGGHTLSLHYCPHPMSAPLEGPTLPWAGPGLGILSTVPSVECTLPSGLAPWVSAR